MDVRVDNPTKRRLFVSLLANSVSRLANTIIQLVQVPVFLHFWSVPLYGEWMIVNSIPAYLSFSNIGFGSVAGNEMTMLVAGGDRNAALRVFQSCWWLIVGICAATIAALCGALYFLPAAHLLKLTNMGESDTKWVIFYLGISILLGQVEQLLQSAYRSIGRYSYGSVMKSLFVMISFAFMMVPVAMGGGPRDVALVFAVANIFFTIVLSIMVKRDIDWIRFGWKHASFAEIHKLLRPAIAFMGFPLGNALNLQGTLLAVGYALGPTDVVIFGTARTVSRVALQMVQMINSTFEPEITISFGARNLQLTRNLHRRACQFALIVAIAIVATMMLFGPWFLVRWTHHQIPPSHNLISILLLVVVIFSLWNTSSTVMTATNQHQRLAVYYIAATSVTCALCYFFALRYGLLGAAMALLASEAAMTLYVLPASLVIVQDTFPAFLASMLDYPNSLRLAALRDRLKRPAADAAIEDPVGQPEL